QKAVQVIHQVSGSSESDFTDTRIFHCGRKHVPHPHKVYGCKSTGMLTGLGPLVSPLHRETRPLQR
ncbi:MAG TPA: hypothetical protein VJW20_17210, partial [Candidatus Angelobacter sp.]|nr:hypothetical protein [Candidatus Angelobacter sp.]